MAQLLLLVVAAWISQNSTMLQACMPVTWLAALIATILLSTGGGLLHEALHSVAPTAVSYGAYDESAACI